jgi:hypothetical protein
MLHVLGFLSRLLELSGELTELFGLGFILLVHLRDFDLAFPDSMVQLATPLLGLASGCFDLGHLLCDHVSLLRELEMQMLPIFFALPLQSIVQNLTLLEFLSDLPHLLLYYHLIIGFLLL